MAESEKGLGGALRRAGAAVFHEPPRLLPCRDCEHPCSRHARVCPHCGREFQGGSHALLRFCGLSILVGAVLCTVPPTVARWGAPANATAAFGGPLIAGGLIVGAIAALVYFRPR